MFYLETLKKLLASIDKNKDIPEEEKTKAKALIKELCNLLALY